MAELIKPIVVNISLIVSLAFLANMVFPFRSNDYLTFKKQVFFGLISSIAALLCMLYPVDTFRSTVFDLRTVPLMVVTLYAGFAPGAICALIICIARLGIGGDYAWIGVMITVIALLTAFGFSKTFAESNKRWKPSLVAGFLYFLFYILIINIYLDFVPNYFYLVYFIPFFLTYFLMVVLIDRLLKINMQLDETIYLGKLSVLGQMAASIAHEIRNPLTTIRGMIQFLAIDTKDEQLKQYSPLLIDELDRSNKIITDYLTLVKPGELKLEKFDLQKVVQDTINLLMPLGAFHNVEIKSKITGSYKVKADEQQFKQCLINIIKNGIEAIDGNGVIRIKANYKHPDQVLLLIEDNGSGMTKNELEKIGLPYYTTKTKGTGLGTMITFRLIQNMGGSVQYKSILDKGTVVIISLPIID
ncbi:ATP-binding protein [Alkalihalobacillus sp. AL-G]|uniref:ATP-binding protein n=1 Tax=Alkalihalobacillus sp. AL-G TaxID=2926399 RepID=UPI0027294FE6|nr:ATP-binding protein [Alkalihalobacillus sp. AL-G]WLD94096.1 ATP-binding protein [Alkalihalobacillus sp. AL-G]